MAESLNGYPSYIKQLERKLKKAERELKRIMAKTQKSQQAHQGKSSEVQLLKDYKERIELTNDLAEKIIHVIESNSDLFKRSAKLGLLVAEAFKVLLVQVEITSCKARLLEKAIQDFLKDIKDTSIKINEQSPVYAALKKLSESSTAAVESSLLLLEKVMLVLKESNVLQQRLGDTEFTYGLTGQLLDMQKVIDIQYDQGSKIKFPRENCPEDYFDITIKEHEEAKKVMIKLLQELNQYKQEKSITEAKTESIKKSKDAAVAASTC